MSLAEIEAELGKLTPTEKLRMMEVLWADLSRDEAGFPSPAWHEPVLRDRDERVRSGQETPLDWEAAKRQLRGRLP